MANNIFTPNNFDEFIGNKEIKEQLKIYIYSAKKRNCTLDHLLLYGNSGCGKTTLANIIAKELNQNIISINAPIIEKPSDLINSLVSINPGDFFFIDEIHRLTKEVEEVLYSALDNFVITLNSKSSDSNKLITLNIPPFTLIGATTMPGKISFPLRNRFSIYFKLENYSDEEISEIIIKNVSKLQLNIEKEGIMEITKRSRNTPRVANNFLKRFFDYSIYYNKKSLNKSFILEIFKKMKIDEYGLNHEDYQILKIVYENFNNRPVSIESIATLLSENETNIIELNEPYLLKLGLMERTKQGRRLTAKGIKYYEEKVRFSLL